MCDLSQGIQTDDQAGTVSFTLSKPDPDFIYSLASPDAYPLPPSVPMKTNIDGTLPGTGPYILTAHDDSHVTLGRNPNFASWDTSVRPDGFPDEIDWVVSSSPDDAAVQVENGDADYMRLHRLDVPSAETLAQVSGQYIGQLHYAANSVTVVTMNTAIAPFNSLDARQALNMAIDRAAVVDVRGGPSTATITCQILPQGWPGYQPYCPYTTHPDPGGRWQAPDLDAARQLVQQSGTSGATVIVGPTYDRLSTIRDYLVGVLRDLGYSAPADTNTDFAYVQTHYAGNENQLSVLEWFSGKLTPTDLLGALTCGQNDGIDNFCDPSYDALYSDARNLQPTDLAASLDKWAQADHTAVDDAVWAPLFNEGTDFVSSRVGNYQYHLFYGALLDQMWVQ
jgi:peptide/nickel transport system substrate-binding protein